jgi:hypothetical protein
MTGLRNPQGLLVGISGVCHRGSKMTAPFVGYDTNVSQEKGLYRILMYLNLRYARQHRLTYHCGTGVGHFKVSRGATAALDFGAIYYRHLPLSQRLFWGILTYFLKKIF